MINLKTCNDEKTKLEITKLNEKLTKLISSFFLLHISRSQNIIISTFIK